MIAEGGLTLGHAPSYTLCLLFSKKNVKVDNNFIFGGQFYVNDAVANPFTNHSARAVMTTRCLKQCELWSTILNGRLLFLSDQDLVWQIYHAFREEVDRLRNASVVERRTPPPPGMLDGQNPHKSPSQILYKEDDEEVNRTFVGVWALKWLLSGNYDQFIKGQPDGIRLTRLSFQWLKEYFESNLKTPQDYFTLLLSIVVNDLGKDPALALDYHEKMPQHTLFGANHDVVLLEAAKVGLVPSLTYLDRDQLENVMLGLELGSELNAAQLAQAENVPVNLEGLLNMRDHEHAFHIKFMEQILDVAGAAGHVYSDGVKNLIEPVFQAFKTVLDVSLSIVRGESSLQQGYNLVLSKRAKMLEDTGFRHLSVDIAEERAFLRLLTMGRTATLKQAELFDAAFKALSDEHRGRLVEGLNIDAIENGETAVIPYYMPAMIAETLRNTRDINKEREALTSLLRYLMRVLYWDDEAESPTLSTIEEDQTCQSPWRPPQKPQLTIPREAREGRVIERNMVKARDTISSPRFKEDPNVLDQLDPPEGYALPRRRPSASA